MVPGALLPRVIGGFLLLGGCGALTVLLGLQECRSSGPPLAASVAEASTRVLYGETLEHVRLGDLALYCDTLHLAHKRAYVGGFGAEGVEGPLVLVELDAEDGCVDGPTTRVGTLERPHRSLLAELGLREHPRVLLLRPQPDNFLGLLVLGLLGLLGGWLLVSGLRTGREQLRRIADEPPADLGADRAAAGDPYRAAASGRSLLPGPLRLSDEWVRGQRRRGVAMRVFSLLCVAGAALWTASFARDALRDHAVWSSGVEATEVQVDGASRPFLLVLEDADLAVAYTDAAGHRHHGRAGRMGLGKIDTRREPVVRPADDPDRFVVSWIIEGFAGALALHLVFVGMLVAFAVASLASVRRSQRELTRVRDVIHSDPEEVALEVLHIAHNDVNGNRVTTTYGLRVPGGASFDLTLPTREYPLFLEIDQSRVLGLRRAGDPGQAVVVREDMTPLAAPPGEAERVRLRWRAGKRPPGEPGIDAFIKDKFANRRRPRAQRSGPTTDAGE